MPPLTVKEAAPLMRVSAATVYALCAAKKIRHQRVGVGRGKILIPPDAVTEYLAKGTVPSADAPPPRSPPPTPRPPAPRHVRMKP